MSPRGPIGFLMVLLAAGCSATIDFRRESLLDAPVASDARVALAPIRYDRAADQARIDALFPGERYAVAPGLAALQAQIVLDLDEFCPARGGPHVALATPWPAPYGAGVPGAGEAPPAGEARPEDAAAKEDPPTEEMFLEAREAGAEIILVLDLDAVEVAWVGPNGWYYLNLAIWYLVWVPSWFVADEVYGMHIEGSIRAYDVMSGRRLPAEDRSFPVCVDTAFAVDDFARGWSVLGIFTAPGSLGPTDWEHLAAYRSEDSPDAPSLLDHGLFQLRRQVAGFAAETLPGILQDATGRGVAATVHALCAGISTYRNAASMPPIPAAADAEAVAASLADLGVPRRNVARLLDGAATSQAFLGQVATIGRRARSDDVVVIYFSGYGTRRGEPLLLFHDADASRPAGAIPGSLSLRAIADALRPLAARRILVILDAGFAAEAGHGRTVAGPDSAERAAGEGTPLSLLVPGKEVILLAAGRAGDPVIDLEGAGHGLFTFALLRSIAPGEGMPADADRNGRIAIQSELVPYITRLVTTHAMADGYEQVTVSTGSSDPATPHWLSVGALGAAGAR